MVDSKREMALVWPTYIKLARRQPAGGYKQFRYAVSPGLTAWILAYDRDRPVQPFTLLVDDDRLLMSIKE